MTEQVFWLLVEINRSKYLLEMAIIKGMGWIEETSKGFYTSAELAEFWFHSYWRELEKREA